MTITKTMNGTKLFAAVSGRLDTVTAPDFETEMAGALKGVTDVTLDFAQLEYIASAGLRALLMIHDTLNGAGSLKIVNANELIKEVFDVTGFNRILVIE